MVSMVPLGSIFLAEITKYFNITFVFLKVLPYFLVLRLSLDFQVFTFK